MSIALEWLAMGLACLSYTPEQKADGPGIAYQFQVIEVHGLQWREAAGRGLKPVASRGGVTVWTAPRNFFKSLPAGTMKEVVASPRVTSNSQAPAHVTIRKNHPFVTQVAWRGEGAAPRQTTETVREGLTSTIAGRSIDQGVLAQLVIEDTDIRSVHTLDIPIPETASISSGKANSSTCAMNVMVVTDIHPVSLDASGNSVLVAEEILIGLDKPLSFKDVFDVCTQHSHAVVGCESICPAAPAKVADVEAKKVGFHAGPEGAGCAVGEANAAECHGPELASAPADKVKSSPKRCAQVQIPEIGHAEIAGEWLIPRDEVLVVCFGPHTIADKDGKAVVRERLALITAEELELPTASTSSDILEVPRSLPRVAISPPRLAIPAIPSRTLPQGVHVDGTPAELPPLPADEREEPSPSDPSQPRPSPQTKKPAQSAAPAAKPSASVDSSSVRTAFELARGLFKPNALPQFTFPNMQFVMPLKPFALKLPFNQRLELELIGRVVPDSDQASERVQADD